MSTPAPIDYEALARQSGAIQSKPAGQKIDYDALAQQAGAIGSGKKEQPQINPPAKPPSAGDDTGVWAGIKRAGSAILGAPYDVAHAILAPPRTPEEQGIASVSNLVPGAEAALGFHRLVTQPMQTEAELSRRQTAIAQATGNEDAQHLANMHAIASGVPIVGPMAANLVQRYLLGDKSGAITEGAAYISAPEATNRVLEVASKLPSPKNPLRGTPQQALSRTLNASGSTPFRESIQIVGADLDAAAQQHPVKTIQDVQKVVNIANDNINAEFNAGIKPIEKMNTVPVEVAQRIKDQITPAMLKTANGRRMANILKQRALEFETQPWTYGELNQERMDSFARLRPFNQAGGEAQAASLRTKADIMADRAINEATKDVVYEGMDRFHNKNLPPGVAPADFSALKRRQAALLDLKWQIDEQVPKIENATDVMRGSGLIERGHVSTYGHPETGRIGTSIHRLQDIFSTPESRANSAARRAFPQQQVPAPPPKVPAVPTVNLYPTPQSIMLGMKSGDITPDEGARMLQKLRRSASAGETRRLNQ